jgi:hypothetical protein
MHQLSKHDEKYASSRNELELAILKKRSILIERNKSIAVRKLKNEMSMIEEELPKFTVSTGSIKKTGPRKGFFNAEEKTLLKEDKQLNKYSSLVAKIDSEVETKYRRVAKFSQPILLSPDEERTAKKSKMSSANIKKKEDDRKKAASVLLEPIELEKRKEQCKRDKVFQKQLKKLDFARRLEKPPYYEADATPEKFRVPPVAILRDQKKLIRISLESRSPRINPLAGDQFRLAREISMLFRKGTKFGDLLKNQQVYDPKSSKKHRESDEIDDL